MLRDAQVFDELPRRMQSRHLRSPHVLRYARDGVVESNVGILPAEEFDEQVANGRVCHQNLAQSP